MTILWTPPARLTAEALAGRLTSLVNTVILTYQNMVRFICHKTVNGPFFGTVRFGADVKD